MSDQVLLHTTARCEIYAEHQRRLEAIRDEAGIEEEVGRFARLAALFRLILEPEQEEDHEVARRLRRLNDWGAITVRPLLLHLLQRRSEGSATSAEVASAMQYVESFLVRRLLIGRATTGLNRILMAAVTEMPKDMPVDDAVRRYLSAGRKYYATETEMHAGIGSVPFYLNGRPHQRSLGLTSHHANRPILIEGDPLPVHLRKSRTVKAA